MTTAVPLVTRPCEVYAHRGSSLVWPENTALAFERAHRAGATGFETDLRLSADGELMLVHDATLARLGRADVSVAQRTRAELERVEVTAAAGGERDRVLALETLLARYPEKDYIFDLKIDDAALFPALEALLARVPPAGGVRFLTWSQAADDGLARAFPGAPQFPSERRTVAWGLASLVGLGRLLEPPNAILSLPSYFKGLGVFGRSQVRSIERRGKRFMGFLVNDERDFRRARRAGVTSFLTDRPDVLVPLCRADGLLAG